MAGVQDQLEIKFRLTDGTDIGPKSFPCAASVATLKETILAQWPKDKLVRLDTFKLASRLSMAEKENGPRTVKDVKLISAGRILENSRTIGECRSPLCDVPGGVTTMHVVVQPPSTEKGTVAF
ncbi:Membrane-anchored ubiquitin-fold protein 2 [Linum perenne]